MVKVHVTTKRCELTPADHQELERHLARLDRRLRYIDPDLAHLAIEIERRVRKLEYGGSFRLSLFNRPLPAKRNAAPTIEALLKQAFDDLEEQLERFKSRLRRAYSHERKRLSLPPEAVRYRERELVEERELLDRALAGDRDAFTVLVNAELPGLSAVIGKILVEQGQEPSPEAIEHVMADVVAIAFRELVHKPARWSLGGWLAWLARREIRREQEGEVVAQSAEQSRYAASGPPDGGHLVGEPLPEQRPETS